MSIARITCGLICFVALAGCHIRPSVEDMTNYNSAQIVKQIRCEARDAIGQLAWEELEKLRPDLAAQYNHLPNKYDYLSEIYWKLTPKHRVNFDQYDSTVIASTFEFDITESNVLTAGMNLQGGFRRGLLKDDFSANNDRVRRNNQTFKITDTAYGLYKVGSTFCTNELKNENWVYPIAGNIGLLRVFRNFFDLNEAKDLINESQVDSYTETITFTTRLGGSASPIWILGALGRGTNIVGANIKADNRREDIHKLVTTITIPKPKESKPAQKKRTQEDNDEQVIRNKTLNLRIEQ